MTRSIAALLLLLAIPMARVSAQITSNVVNKSWNDPTAWVGGVVPTATDDVVIAAGATITVNVGSITVDDIEIRGTLDFTYGGHTVNAGTITVKSGGAFVAGTEAAPYGINTSTGAVYSLIINLQDKGNREFLVESGGTIEMHGAKPNYAWTKLAQSVQHGQNQITVDGLVDWRVGDQIVIASTDFDWNQREIRNITAISTGGSTTTLTLSSNLTYDHWGQTVGGGRVDERAEVGLLTRRIRIHGPSSATTTHLGVSLELDGTINPSSPITFHIEGVHFNRMGDEVELGQYPIHLHHLDSSPGMYVRDCAILDCYNRAIAIHDTRDISVERNVVANTIGHAIYFEDGSESGVSLRSNLVLGVYAPAAGLIPLVDTDIFPAAFYIQNLDNDVELNSAAGGEGEGFYWKIPLSQTYPNLMTFPVRFESNTAHSNKRHGIYSSGRPFFPDHNDTTSMPGSTVYGPAVFQDFTAYKNSGRPVYFRCWGSMIWGSMKLADNGSGAYFATEGTPVTDLLGYQRVTHAVVIGESENRGFRQTGQSTADEIAHGSIDGTGAPWSLPIGYNSANTAGLLDLLGFESYDGAVILESVTALGFDPAKQHMAGGRTRKSAVVGTDQEPAPWEISPRNTLGALSIDTTSGPSNPVYLSPGQMLSAYPGVAVANAVNNTIWCDESGDYSGGADQYIVSPHVTDPAQGSFLLPSAHVGTGPVTFRSDLNAWIVPRSEGENSYASLMLVDHGFTTAPTFGLWTEIRHGLSGAPGLRPVYRSYRASLDSVGPTVHSFPINLLLGGEYALSVGGGMSPIESFTLQLRSGDAGKPIIVECPMPTSAGATAPTVYVGLQPHLLFPYVFLFLTGSVTLPVIPGVAATSLSDLQTQASGTSHYYWDSVGKLYVRMEMPTTIWTGGRNTGIFSGWGVVAMVNP